MNALSVIGKEVKRIDGREKVTGSAKYVGDMKFGPTLCAKVLRSPHPHARIVRIDTKKASQLPGVRAIVTGADCPRRVGLYLADRTIYAFDKVRYVGEPVAGVAADSESIAERALELIEIEYEQLETVFDPVKAVEPGAPLLHEDLGDYKVVPFIFPKPGTNISNHFKLRKGDVQKAFGEADLIVENTYYVPQIQHSAIERHVAIAQMSPAGKLTIWSSSQSPNAIRMILCSAFDLPTSRLRVVTTYLGGGFGGKAGLTVEGLVVPLAMKCPGRMVRMIVSREEEFRDTFVRQGLVARLKHGVTKAGKIIAEECEFYWSGGAYTEYGVNIVRSGGYCCTGPYEIPNVKSDSYCVYTNMPVGGPMRGFGMPEIHWAIEQQMDEISRILSIDPVEIRKLNALKDGSIGAYGAPMKDVALIETIEEAVKLADWKSRPRRDGKTARGKGIACMFKAPSMPPNAQSSAIIKMNEDGTVNVLTTSMDMGQGSMTALAQIAAEELGVPVESVTVSTPDTDYTPYEWQTVASRISYSCGNAVRLAARDARMQVLHLGAIAFGVREDDMDIKDGLVFLKDDPGRYLPISQLALGLTLPSGGGIGGPVIGRGCFIPEGLTGLDPETGLGEKPAPFYTYGTQVAEVEVDTETGQVKVVRVSAAYDAGKVINPQLAEQQVKGGIVQGIGAALFEELRFSEGRLLNGSFTDYKIPSTSDIPEEMNVSLLEVKPIKDGPFGVRGIAEPCMVPTAPAIANAIYDAIGVRIRSLPITPEKILEALREKTMIRQ